MTSSLDGRYVNSSRAHSEARAFIAGGVNSSFRSGGDPCPLTFVRGEGSHIIDVDDNDYIDYALGMGPLILGHSSSTVTKAVTDVLSRGQLFAGQHQEEVELARLLVEAIPCAERVRLGQSGTEMNLLALRIARAHTGRQKFIRFVGHYHGWADPLLIDANHAIDTPGITPGQSSAAASDACVLDWNDLPALEQVLEQQRHEVAAIIMEPILCNTGVIQPRPGYLQGVRRLADTYGVILIFDEVITGFRVGIGGAQGLLDVKPDLATFAKALASGFPMAALAGRLDLMSMLADGVVMHGGTYNTGLTATAAALATMRLLISSDPYPAIYRSGEILMEGISAAAHSLDVPLVVEGLGPVFHTRFGPPEQVHDFKSYHANSDTSLRRTFVKLLQDQGIRITSRGTWFMSTAHTDDDIDRTLARVERALAGVKSYVS
jgi:glutamate-1-semialdehyde 2,1-aminomutase